MKKSRWITEQWLKMLWGVLLIGEFVGILRAFQIITTYEMVQLLFVGALLLVTFVYAIETSKLSRSAEGQARSAEEQAWSSAKMVMEMEEQRHELLRPIITFKLEYYGIHKDLRLRNIGFGPALNPYLVIYIGDNTIFEDFDPIEVNDNSDRVSKLDLVRLKSVSFRLIRLIARYQNLYGDCYESTQQWRWKDISAEKESLVIQKISNKVYIEGKLMINDSAT